MENQGVAKGEKFGFKGMSWLLFHTCTIESRGVTCPSACFMCSEASENTSNSKQIFVIH